MEYGAVEVLSTIETLCKDGRSSARMVALEAARSLEDGKGQSVTTLHVEGLTLIADYFVIASGSTSRHVKALADRVLDALKDIRQPDHIEGYNTGFWVLLDYGDVVVHVFRETERSFYGLERLWGDAPRLETSAAVAPSSTE